MQQIGVALQAVALRNISYEEVGPSADAPLRAPEQGSRMDMDFGLEGQVALLPDNFAEVTLRLELRPDPSVKPIHVAATMTALFRRDAGVATKDFLTFINGSAGIILFPYLREVVSSVTGRGIFGPLHIDPLRVGPLISDEAIAQAADADST